MPLSPGTSGLVGEGFLVLGWRVAWMNCLDVDEVGSIVTLNVDQYHYARPRHRCPLDFGSGPPLFPRWLVFY
jgi:hypothetical protein